MPRKAQRSTWGCSTEIQRNKKYILRWMQNTSTGRRRMCETFYGTRTQADARLAEIRLKNERNASTMTVGDVCRTWYIPWLKRRVESGATKEGTMTRYLIAVEDNIMPRWENTPIDSTPPVEIQRWLMEMTANEASIAIVVMRKIMDFPVQYEMLDTNRFRLKYEMPTRKAREKRAEIYTLAKATDVFDRLRGSMCEAQFILACFGSARVGESLGVRRCEVEEANMDGMRFAIVPIIRRMPNTGSDLNPDGDLKTKESARDLIIPEPYGTRLLEIASNGIVDGSEWLAPQHNGEPMSCGQLGWYWRRDSAPDHIPFSNLRTSWRTFAQYEWGIDYDTCEVLMGHRLQGVTGSHYLKPTRQQLLEKVAGAMRQLGKVR